MERALLDSRVPVTVLRPCAIYGRFGRHPREWWFIKRGLDKRPAIPVAFGARSVFHTTSASSLAQLIELRLRDPQKTILNVGDPEPPTVAEIARAIGAATGMTLPLAPFEGPPGEDHVGSTPWSVPLPFTVDCGRAQALGWAPRAYADEVSEMCRWIMDVAADSEWREHFTMFAQYGYDPFDYAAEDAFLKARDYPAS